MSDRISHYLDNLAPWEGALYAANTGHHRRYDDAFLATIPLTPTDRVLDVGCGAGDFTATVAGLVPDGHVIGLEPQPSLVAEATARAGANQSFIQAPAQQLDAVLPDDGTFDLTMSRSVLHWVPFAEHPAILRSCLRLLRPGGALRIECGGGDNVREVVAFLDDVAAPFGIAGVPWHFVGAGAYLDLLLETGFSVNGGFVTNPAQRRAFDRESVLGWLRSQAVQAYEVRLDDPAARAAFRAEVEARVDELRRADGTYDLTFVRLDLLAFAPT